MWHQKPNFSSRVYNTQKLNRENVLYPPISNLNDTDTMVIVKAAIDHKEISFSILRESLFAFNQLSILSSST